MPHPRLWNHLGRKPIALYRCGGNLLDPPRKSNPDLPSFFKINSHGAQVPTSQVWTVYSDSLPKCTVWKGGEVLTSQWRHKIMPESALAVVRYVRSPLDTMWGEWKFTSVVLFPKTYTHHLIIISQINPKWRTFCNMSDQDYSTQSRSLETKKAWETVHPRGAWGDMMIKSNVASWMGSWKRKRPLGKN